jgi:hypothetical protein
MFDNISKVLNIFWALPIVAQLRGAVQAAVVRGLRGVVGSFMAVIIANAVAGTLFPAQWDQFTVVMLTGFVLGFDKWLRDHNLELKRKKGLA